MQIKSIAFLSLIVIALASFQNVLAYRMADSTTVAPTATPVASSAITATPTFQPSAPPLSLTLTLAITCCAVGGVLGFLVLGFILSRENLKEEKKK